MAFTRDKPAATDLLSASQDVIKQNFNTSDDVMDIDHFPFSNTGANKGFHKTINQPQQTRTRSGVGAVYAGFPASSASLNKLITASYITDATVSSTSTQLFSLSSNGEISQLTGHLTSVTTDGWQWMGGILMQWGTVSTASSSGVVTFKNRVAGAIEFPNNLFVVTLGIKSSLTGQNRPTTYVIDTSGTNTDKTKFTWNKIENPASGIQYTGFYWIAIGN